MYKENHAQSYLIHIPELKQLVNSLFNQSIDIFKYTVARRGHLTNFYCKQVVSSSHFTGKKCMVHFQQKNRAFPAA
jgi:hypothetical protein